MHSCHLDISLELILNSDGYYTINNNIEIKFVDFGLAEFFDINNKFEFVKLHIKHLKYIEKAII